MALAESAALGILACEPDRRSLREQGGKRQRFGVRPIDGSDQPLAPPLELSLQLWVHREADRHREQLLVQFPEHLCRHGGFGLGHCLVDYPLWLLTAAACPASAPPPPPPFGPGGQARLPCLLGLGRP